MISAIAKWYQDAMRYQIMRKCIVPRTLHKELRTFYGISPWTNINSTKGESAESKIDAMLDEALEKVTTHES